MSWIYPVWNPQDQVQREAKRSGRLLPEGVGFDSPSGEARGPIDVYSSIESYTLNTDALRLQQLLTNLLSNAAKFTSEGEINLSFTVDEGKEEVRFSVTDTGCGIPEDKCEKIFERFEKLDDFIQGTGLGLSVCQIISEQLNGSLSVDISYKDGARFVFIHPTNLIETPYETEESTQ